MQQSNVSRRDFFKTTAAAGAVLSLSAATYNRAAGANGRIGVGFVGVGGRCQSHLGILNKLRDQRKGAGPVAVCDVYKTNLEIAEERTGAKTYHDYRDLLKDPHVDVVCIATPDHW